MLADANIATYLSNYGGYTTDDAPTSVEILLNIHKNAPEVFDVIRMETRDEGTMSLRCLHLGLGLWVLDIVRRIHMFGAIKGSVR